MIARWGILNLKDRLDRKLLATCSAARAGVPEDIIHFWHGERFKTPEALQDAGIAAGFPNIARTIELLQNPEIKNKKKLFNIQNHTYNILMYLKDRITRPGFEVIVHDDVYLYDATSFEILEDICSKIGSFNIFLLNASYAWIPYLWEREKLGWAKDFFAKDPIPVKGIPEVTKGLNSNCDFALVLSQKGAKMIYERLLKRKHFLECIEYLVMDRNDEKEWEPTGKWEPEGAYTSIKDIAGRYEIGSDIEANQ